MKRHIVKNAAGLQGLVNSQVIYVAWIWHLLDVDPEWPVVACVNFNDAVFNHILQVSKTSPDVSLVLHGVCSRTRIPVPEREDTEE